ncbi:MAG TPA: fatty acid--CoA ligase family protein, partial [bacterium]
MWIDSFRVRVQAHPERMAVVIGGRGISYSELWERCRATGLRAAGDQPGTRQIVAERDPLECLERVIGAWIHGKVPVVIAPTMPAETVQQLRRRIAGEPLVPVRPDQGEAMILATSGSTDMPKLVAVPHGRFIHTRPVISRWYDLPEETQVLVAAAMHTAAVLTTTALHGLASGWTLHLFPAGAPGSVLQAYMNRQGMTVMNGPPSLFRLFLRYGESGVFPSVRHILVGGEPVPRQVLEQMRAAFPMAKIHIHYGMTESGAISMLPIDDPRAYMGGCGVPFEYLETRIAPVQAIPSPAGRLLLRGPTVCLGYLQDDGTYSGLDEEGFIHTDDLVRPDPDGCLFNLGRMSGLLKVGGLMVNPQEVQQAMQGIPGVADALCWAEPHPLLGNAIAAQVVLIPGVPLDERTLRRECQGRMEKHKVPRTITVVEQLALTPAGKRSLKPDTAHVDR